MEWIKTSDRLPKVFKLSNFSDSVLGWSKKNTWEEVFLYKSEDGLVWIPIAFYSNVKRYSLDYYTHWMPITAPAED